MKTPSNHFGYSLQNPPPKGWKLKHIHKIAPLKGSSNSVHLAEITCSKEVFVLKKLPHCGSGYPPFSSAALEKQLHLEVDHPNVVRTLGVILGPEADYVMTEYAEEGDLLQSLFAAATERELAGRIRDVAVGLKYLHARGVVHRDVKAENVVINKAGRCQLIDFGFAARLEENGESYLKDDSKAGTLEYLSPELVWGLPYNHQVDVWALGVLCYLLLCKQYPFSAKKSPNSAEYKREKSLIQAIVAGKVSRCSGFRNASRNAKDFILGALREVPQDRYSLDELLSHPFLTRASEGHSPVESSSTPPSSSSSAERLEKKFGERGEMELFSGFL